MDNPTISVVIPVRGKLDLLSRALNSSVMQTLQPTEIVLVDDSVNGEEKDKVKAIFSDFTLLMKTAKIATDFILVSSGGAVPHQHEIWELNIQDRTS